MRRYDPLEAHIESSVVTYAERFGHLAFKLNNRSDTGWTDRLFVTVPGIHYYIEFKRLGEDPEPLQRYRIGQLIANSCSVFVVDSIKEGRNIVDYYEAGAMGAAPVSKAWHPIRYSAKCGRPAARPWTGEDDD